MTRQPIVSLQSDAKCVMYAIFQMEGSKLCKLPPTAGKTLNLTSSEAIIWVIQHLQNGKFPPLTPAWKYNFPFPVACYARAIPKTPVSVPLTTSIEVDQEYGMNNDLMTIPNLYKEIQIN